MKKGFLSYILLPCLISTITIGLVFARYRDNIFYNRQLKQQEARLTDLNHLEYEGQKLLSTNSDTLDGLKQNLATKEAKYNQTNTDYAAKLAELKAATKKAQDLQAKLSSTASAIAKLRTTPPLFTFTVESSNIANIEQKKEDIKVLVTGAYDVIVSLYSQPYLLHSVTISFVDSLKISGAYAETEISNGPNGLSLTIRIKDFNKDNYLDVTAIIHEIVHSFHGLALIDPPAYEEGITVAATDAIMGKLIEQKKIPNFNPLYIRISLSDYLNSSLTLPRGNAFYTDSNTATYYQIAGFGWFEIYKADSSFFKDFNEAMYQKVRNGEKIDESGIRQLIKNAYSGSVDNKSIDEWLNTKAFQLQ